MSAAPLPNPFAGLAAFALEPFGASEAEQRAALLELSGIATPLPDAMLIAALPAAANDTEREAIIAQLIPIRQCRQCGAVDQPGVHRVWLEPDLCDCGL